MLTPMYVCYLDGFLYLCFLGFGALVVFPVGSSVFVVCVNDLYLCVLFFKPIGFPNSASPVVVKGLSSYLLYFVKLGLVG